MAYSTVLTSFRYGDQSDYSDRLLDAVLEYSPSSPSRYLRSLVTGVAAPGTAFDLSSFSTILAVGIHNQSNTTACTITYRSSAGGATDQKQSVPIDGVIALSDVVIANDLTFTGVATCEVIIIGT